MLMRAPGELEATMVKSFVRGANLRRWLNRPNCPTIIREFKRLFDKTFSPKKDLNLAASAPQSSQHIHAHYTFSGVTFSRASTHLGNSLINYYPTPSSTRLVAGSIQKIETVDGSVVFSVKRQVPLPSGEFDPFQRYPALGATIYANKMLDGPLDVISPLAVLNHVARLDISSDRTVILNLTT